MTTIQLPRPQNDFASAPPFASIMFDRREYPSVASPTDIVVRTNSADYTIAVSDGTAGAASWDEGGNFFNGRAADDSYPASGATMPVYQVSDNGSSAVATYFRDLLRMDNMSAGEGILVFQSFLSNADANAELQQAFEFRWLGDASAAKGRLALQHIAGAGGYQGMTRIGIGATSDLQTDAGIADDVPIGEQHNVTWLAIPTSTTNVSVYRYMNTISQGMVNVAVASLPGTSDAAPGGSSTGVAIFGDARAAQTINRLNGSVASASVRVGYRNLTLMRVNSSALAQLAAISNAFHALAGQTPWHHVRGLGS